MATTAFVIGFFTALGWWSAGKITKTIDTPPTITQQENQKEK